ASLIERKRGTGLSTDELRGLLAAIVQSSDDAIVGSWLDGTIFSWNEGAERLIGYRAEEILGHPLADVLPAERRQELSQIMARVAAGERARLFETVRHRIDGRLVHLSLSISPIREDAGRIIGASATARDVTERLQAESNIRASEQRFRGLADCAPIMIW